MAWGAFGASNPNPAFAGAQSSGRGASSSNARIRRLAVLGTAAGLASGLGIQRRAAHAKMGGSSEKQGKQTIGAFTHAMAGAFAGGVSRVVVAPLDVVKIRMQVQVEPVSGMSGGKYRGIV